MADPEIIYCIAFRFATCLPQAAGQGEDKSTLRAVPNIRYQH